MALQVIHYDFEGSGLQINLGANDDVFVPQGFRVVSTSGVGIQGTGSGHTAHVEGVVGGTTYAIHLGDAVTDTNQTVLIGANASVAADSFTVRLEGAGSRVVNHGQIASENYAVIISVGASAGAGSVVENRNLIVGNWGVSRGGSIETALLTLRNSGTILADEDSFYSQEAAARDVIINTGLMHGDVVTNGGRDFYDGRGGRLEGNIEMGADRDRIDARGGRITDGVVYGGGGADTILLGAGGNRIIGGTWHDTILGGAGNDSFTFLSPGEGGDTINDFSRKSGNNDSFLLEDSAFGLPDGPLAAGRFHTSSTNKAHDANDRFIFRTTDATLWFDADGKGGAGPVLIADLQAGAVVTAVDIFLG